MRQPITKATVAVEKWTKFQQAVATARTMNECAVAVRLPCGSVYYAYISGAVIADHLLAQNSARLWEELEEAGAGATGTTVLAEAAE